MWLIGSLIILSLPLSPTLSITPVFLPPPSEHFGLNPKGKTLAVAELNGTVQHWDSVSFGHRSSAFSSPPPHFLYRHPTTTPQVVQQADFPPLLSRLERENTSGLDRAVIAPASAPCNRLPGAQSSCFEKALHIGLGGELPLSHKPWLPTTLRCSSASTLTTSMSPLRCSSLAPSLSSAIGCPTLRSWPLPLASTTSMP